MRKKYLGEPVEEAVISVPAYLMIFREMRRRWQESLPDLLWSVWSMSRRQRLAYRFGKTKEDQTFLVFDFGGGTLDISIVDAFDSVIEIVAVAGDNHLGGMM